jgi:hypothetical protein
VKITTLNMWNHKHALPLTVSTEISSSLSFVKKMYGKRKFIRYTSERGKLSLQLLLLNRTLSLRFRSLAVKTYFFVYSKNESPLCFNQFDACNFLIKKITSTAFHSTLLQPSCFLYLFLIYSLSFSYDSTLSYFPSGMFSFLLVLFFPQMKY